MNEIINNKYYKILNGNMLDMLQVIEKESIDAIVTDPPYGLTSITKRFGKENSAPAQYGKDGSFARLSKGFMGKEWDGSGIEYNVEAWRKCFDVLKEGGYLLAFGGSRTFHRIAVAIEDAGFEIRDTIMWLYGSGFPKSHNIGLSVDKLNGVESKVVGESSNARPNSLKENNLYQAGTVGKEFSVKQAQNEWQGWGTALKPAYEPIIVARKPMRTTVAENVMINGVGGINIDECRIPFEDTQNPATNPLYRQRNNNKYKQIKKGQESNGAVSFTSSKNDISSLGRFPANVIHDDSFEIDEETQASRYFYTAKASKKDRDEGLSTEEKQTTDGCIRSNLESARKFGANSALRKNIHPTVKPVELMQYLVRLVSPKGATILDPFMGSGSTGKAVMFENRERNANYKFIGIDLDEKYCQLSSSHIDYALNKYEYDFNQELQVAKKQGQLNIFDIME